MFRIFSYLCDIEICKPKVDDSDIFYPFFQDIGGNRLVLSLL